MSLLRKRGSSTSKVLCKRAMGIGQAKAATLQKEMLFTLLSGERIHSDGYDHYVDETYTSFWGIDVGSTAYALITIDYAEAGEHFTDFMVQLGQNTIFDGQLSLRPEDLLKSFVHNYLAFSWVDVIWDGEEGQIIYTSDNRPYYEEVRATLTPAPVPLPATVALLPFGIGAFAVMRRRRRQSA